MFLITLVFTSQSNRKPLETDFIYICVCVYIYTNFWVTTIISNNNTKSKIPTLKCQEHGKMISV